MRVSRLGWLAFLLVRTRFPHLFPHFSTQHLQVRIAPVVAGHDRSNTSYPVTWISRLSAVLIIAALFGVGFWQFRRRLRELDEMLSFTDEYGKSLKRYVDTKGHDGNAYTWLTHRSTRMQLQMGSTGVLAKYKPPAANYFISNVAIITNFIPELRQCFQTAFLDRIAYQYAQMIQDALLRHHGILTDRRDSVQSQLRNPLNSFREGVRTVLESPLQILGSLGAVPARWIVAVGGSSIFNILAGVASLVTIVSGIIAATVGWHEFWEIVKRALP